MHQMFKGTTTWNCQALNLAKMSQNIKKAFKMSIKTWKVNETGSKINFPRIWRQPCRKMNPSWPYAKKSIIASRCSVLYIHSIPPAQPALRRPGHSEKPINLIVSLPVRPASSQPRNTTSGQTSNSAKYSYGQTSRIWSTAKIQEMLGLRLPRPSITSSKPTRRWTSVYEK